MKKNLLLVSLLFFTMTLFIVSCQKETDNPAAKQQPEEGSSASQNSLHGHLIQTKEYATKTEIRFPICSMGYIRNQYFQQTRMITFFSDLKWGL